MRVQDLNLPGAADVRVQDHYLRVQDHYSTGPRMCVSKTAIQHRHSALYVRVQDLNPTCVSKI